MIDTSRALHFTIAGDLSCFSIKASGGDPFPDRELRPKFRAMVVERCGPMDVDMMSDDKGLIAWCGRPLVASPIGLQGAVAFGAVVVASVRGSS